MVEEKLDNAQAFTNDMKGGQHSVNLMRNLQRELCLLKDNNRQLQNKINNIKKSKEFFEFRENITLVKEYKREI